MSPKTVQSPNVLVIVTDDQRYDTIGALGNPYIHTPALDTLAHSGFSFSRGFCTTPICTPARAELLTGCTSFGNHVPWFGMPINPDLTLLPSAFRNAGYHTVHVGKWHNDGHPRDKGYDETHCVFAQDNCNNHREQGHFVRFEEEDGEVSGHSSEVFVDAACNALKRSPRERPWFCYLAFFAPHDPHEAPEPFSGLYNPADMPLLPDFMPEHPFDNGDMVIRDELLENWPRTHEVIRRYRARYYAVISHMDRQIGRLLGWLRSTGDMENTVIAFAGDQGLAIGSHGLLGKENMYDHSIGSPLIYHGPGVPAGGCSNALAHHVDLFPTLCGLAGVERPDTARDGHSLVPVMQGSKERVREDILCEFYSPEEPGGELRHTQRAVRTEEWKLTWYPLTGRYQLFNLVRDPLEMVDLLVPWRRRRRIAVESGGSVWTKDIWAARDPIPAFAQKEIESVSHDLLERMTAQMEELGDPVLNEQRPDLKQSGSLFL